jgi:hypothetical protein
MTPEKPSGLKNPARAVRALGAMALSMEAIVLLLAIQPIRMLQGHLTGLQLGVLIGAAVTAIVLAGLMSRPAVWWLGLALQVLLIVAGLLSWVIAAVGIIFGLVWLYAMNVRRHVLS